MGRDERRAWTDRVDRSLRLQTRLFLGMFVVMLVVVAFHLVRDGVSPLWALAGLLMGLALGVLLARTKRLSWSPERLTVVGTMDVIGAAILVLYLVFIVFRNRIIGGAVDSQAVVGVVGLSITAGSMLGRVAGTVRGVRRILATAGILPADRS